MSGQTKMLENMITAIEANFSCDWYFACVNNWYLFYCNL